MRRRLARIGFYIFLLGIIFILSIPLNFRDMLRHEASARGESSLFETETLNFLFMSVFGAVLGVEHFVRELKKRGKWRFNFLKLFVLGLPSLFVSISEILYFNGFYFIGYVLSSSIFDYTSYKHMMQVLFGYAVITSFYRREGPVDPRVKAESGMQNR